MLGRLHQVVVFLPRGSSRAEFDRGPVIQSEQSDYRGVLLISGVPAAGKTTVSEIVARRLPRSALIHGDQIQNLVISGRRRPNEEPPFEADQQLRLRDRNMAALANNFVDGGFLTVIDDVFVYK